MSQVVAMLLIIAVIFAIFTVGGYVTDKQEAKEERQYQRHKNDEEKQQATDFMSIEYQKLMISEIWK